MYDDEIEQGLRLEGALNQLGLSMYTDEWAAKVLAFVYYLHGTDEEVVANPGFSFAIQCSIKKLDVDGEPNHELFKLVLKYTEELKAKREETPWLKEIKQRYKLE